MVVIDRAGYDFGHDGMGRRGKQMESAGRISHEGFQEEAATIRRRFRRYKWAEKFGEHKGRLRESDEGST